ncbi:hypothetical protein [Rhizobium leguminosarum]|nr:hypothetical protein [Rhizobium leguminosarum]
MPAKMQARHKQLNRRSNLLFKLSRRDRYQDVLRTPQWQRVERLYDDAWDRLNKIIIRYFTASEQPPIGLEDFLKENGIA